MKAAFLFAFFGVVGAIATSAAGVWAYNYAKAKKKAAAVKKEWDNYR